MQCKTCGKYISLVCYECGADVQDIASDENKFLYHLMWMIVQFCGGIKDDEIYETHYNADAFAVHNLAEKGLVKITDGKWPDTKFLTFTITDEGNRVLRWMENETTKESKS